MSSIDLHILVIYGHIFLCCSWHCANMSINLITRYLNGQKNFCVITIWSKWILNLQHISWKSLSFQVVHVFFWTVKHDFLRGSECCDSVADKLGGAWSDVWEWLFSTVCFGGKWSDVWAFLNGRVRVWSLLRTIADTGCYPIMYMT